MNKSNGQTEPLNEIYEKPDFIFTPNEHHEWRQESVYLICKSCELIHAAYIGIDKILIGLNEQGQPILKNKDEYFKKK